jgi:hypothetical protein
VVFRWRWFYHLPGLAFWALVVVPLVLVKENRRLSAWAILVPLGLVVVLCQMLTNLSSAPSAAAEGSRVFLVTFATGWAVVWLLGFWFASRHRRLALGATFFVMVAVGLLSYLCNFGVARGEVLPTLSIYYVILALALMLPLWLSSWCCRRVYRPVRFMFWLLLWTSLMLPGMLGLCFGAVALLTSSGPQALAHALAVMPMVALLGGIYGVVLYLINLPFMLLMFRNSLYRERFCKVFGLQAATNLPAAVGTTARDDTLHLGEIDIHGRGS